MLRHLYNQKLAKAYHEKIYEYELFLKSDLVLRKADAL